MKMLLRPITFFTITGLFFYISIFTTSCKYQLSKNDSLNICNDLLEKQNCCSISIDCKGLKDLLKSHLYAPFIAESKIGVIGIIIAVEQKKYLSYSIKDSSISNDKNVIKILKFSSGIATGENLPLNALTTYQTFSVKIDELACETFELVIEDDSEGNGTDYKKGRGKIIRNTSKNTDGSLKEDKEEVNKK